MQPNGQKFTEALLHKGIDEINRDRFASAQQVFEKILAAEPSQPVALYLLGLTHCKQGNWAEAEPCLRTAMAISPERPDVALQLVQTLRALQRPGEAVPLCQKILLQAPGHVGALVELAKAHQESEDWEAAEKLFRHLLHIAPAADVATLNLSEILCASGRAAEAEILLRNALAKPGAGLNRTFETKDALTFLLAVSLRAQRRHRDALQKLDEIASPPGAPVQKSAQVERASLLQYLSQFNEAIDVYNEVLETEPGDLNAHLLLNEAIYRLKRDDRFLTSYDHAAMKGADLALMQATKGGFLLKLNRTEEARRAFRLALEKAPDDPYAVSGLAKCAEALGDISRAVDLHARNHLRHPDNAVVTIDYASAMLRLGESELAGNLAENVIRARPFDQGALALLGLCDRALNSGREFLIHDFDKFVQVFDLEAPPGYRSMAEFNAKLANYLEELHGDAREYFTQTVRGGTRLFGEVFNNGHRMVEDLQPIIEAAVGKYIAALDSSDSHPFLARRARHFRYSGSWSSCLADRGYHLNHYHSEGWISASYYVAVPDVASDETARQGWIKFGQPTSDFGAAFTPRRFVQPKPGRLVLFPSYMWHGTEPFSSPQIRTTIAFDIVPRGVKA